MTFNKTIVNGKMKLKRLLEIKKTIISDTVIKITMDHICD